MSILIPAPRRFPIWLCRAPLTHPERVTLIDGRARSIDPRRYERRWLVVAGAAIWFIVQMLALAAGVVGICAVVLLLGALVSP